MKKVFVAIFSILSVFRGQAQYSQVNIEATDHLVKEKSGLKPMPVQAEFIGFRDPVSDDLVWQPLLTKISENESENDELLEKIKKQKARLRASANPTLQEEGAAKTTTVTAPVVSTNFAGINNGGANTPLDNTIAISDKDTIICMVNSMVTYYTSTGTSIFSKSIYNFVNDVTLNNSLCDPKVIWDNKARRFIFYTQVCDGVSANSKIVIGFSKTSNPTNGWYFYKFSGDPLGNGMWWDYPKLAVSTDDVFVTGNLFSESSNSFSESVILQIQKSLALTGTTPLSQLWSGISGAFSILPVGYGQSGSYGPGIYAVSCGGSTGGRSEVSVYEITNKIGGTPAAILNTYVVPTPVFSTAGDATQKGSTLKLNTGDSRALDGFYQKGIINFVHNADAGSGFCGIKYYRIKVSSLTASVYTLGHGPVSDYCYPAIAPATNDSNNKGVIVAFNESGDTIYPRACVVACDNSGAWSAPVVVKAGASYLSYSFTSGPTERWGDYTGMCKRFGDTANSVWMAGMYASSSHRWLQWVAKIKGAANLAVPMLSTELTRPSIYPNPVIDKYSVRFDLREKQNIIINLTDMNGRVVVELYNGIAENGDNYFSFNKGALSNGIYSLNIFGPNTNIKNEKIVISGN